MVAGAVRREQGFRGLRPFNPVRDLDEVASLLRLAFSEELGRRETAWLHEMQSFSSLTPLVWLLDQVNIAIGRLLHGFVWIAHGQIVGNVTITRVTSEHWLISNMAVHPDYRRQGIARALLARSVDWIGERRARWVTLEVRHDNEPATSLYRDLGFVIVDGTTEMERQGVGSVSRVAPPEGYRLRAARADDAGRVFALAREVTPQLAQRIEPLRRRDFEMRGIDRVLNGIRGLIGLPVSMRWVVTAGGRRVVAALNVRRGGYDHRIRLLVHPTLRGLVEEALVTRALEALSGQRGTVRSEVDAAHMEAREALGDYGFREVRTLDRMALDLAQ